MRYFVIAVSASLIFASTTLAMFTFSPVKMYLLPRKTAVTLTVSNPGEKTVLMQLETWLWTQKGGSDILERTDDILAVPPVFSLPPNKTQIIRIAAPDHKTPERELSYRFYLTEIPLKPEDTDKNSVVGVSMRVNLPFFIEPEKAKRVLDWSIQRSGDRKITVMLHNRGNVHTQLTKIALLSLPNRITLLPERTIGTYILPGQSHTWSFDLKDIPPSRLLIVFNEADRAKKEVTVDIGDVQQQSK